jgi:hypothetical protein
MSHVPAYVYVLFLALLWMGVARCFPRTIRVERLLIMPALMTVLGVRGFVSLFHGPDNADLFAAVLGAAIGLAIGYRHVRRWAVRIDRSARTIAVPGDVMMLVIILATFAFEFALHYGIDSAAAWAGSALVPPVSAAVWSLFVGMSAGRNAKLALRFFHADMVRQAAAPNT